MSEFSSASCSPRPKKKSPWAALLSRSKPELPSSQESTPPPRSTPLTEADNKAYIQELRLRVFLEHLAQWASDHDTSPHFHGSIGVLAGGSADETFQLGQSVRCILTHSDHPDVRKQIVIRLFPPRAQHAKYSMVVRCGAGWMSARDFLNKEFFVLLQAERKKKTLKDFWSKNKMPPVINPKDPEGNNKARVQALVPVPDSRNSVSVSPSFHPFLRLPQELQNMIWIRAAGLTGMYRPCRHRTSDYPVPHIHENFYAKPNSPITLSTMLRVSKALNTHMASWVYRTTKFHFELTGFTNFLWISGPTNRANLRRVTFKFSSLAPLHCLRWLAPDPVFLLFDPPAYTSPHGLQYFWRCQIQDLARDLHLHTLTLDLQGVQPNHVQMVVRVLRQAFGSVEFVKFQEDGKDIDEEHWRLDGLRGNKSWRDMCKEWFSTYKNNQGYMSDKRRGMTMGDLERDMDADKDFFDCVEDLGSVLMP
ncbi:hypothetical protein N0V90_008507 [Kalmusia sp. IMI 367209]|nr:hypothetical protein N0V90_008507 [Kalmusia sp. IMI 367209]